MGILCGTLAQLGYWWAYRVLDAQYFGVAQMRRRVFIVGHLAEPTYPTKVLFEPESCERNTAPSRETGARVAAPLTRGSATGCGVNEPGRRCEDDVNLICNAFNGYTGGGNDYDAQGKHLIAHTLTAPDTNAPLKKGKRQDGSRTDRIPIIAFDKEPIYSEDLADTIAQDHPPAIAFTERTRKQGRTLDIQEELAYAVTNPGGGGRTNSRQIAYAVSENQRAEMRLTPYSRQLTSGGGKPGQGFPAALTQYGVRRLTPTECERLQGFPDSWTDYGIDENGERVEMSDSVRYRMLGNAVCRNVALWIARRIVELEANA